jgi:hypothetical protein
MKKILVIVLLLTVGSTLAQHPVQKGCVVRYASWVRDYLGKNDTIYIVQDTIQPIPYQEIRIRYNYYVQIAGVSVDTTLLVHLCRANP